MQLSLRQKLKQGSVVRSYLPSGLVWVVCIAFAGWLVVTSSQRVLSALEAVLLQLVMLSASVFASYLFSRISAQTRVADLVRTQARPSFRRVVSLYIALGGLSARVRDLLGQAARFSSRDLEEIDMGLQMIIRTSADTLEDWRDLVPEEVADIERHLETTGDSSR